MMTAPKRSPNEAFEVVSGSIGEASEVLKAMASDTRLKIMCALSEGGELPVGELAELTGQSHSAVSQHLAKLRAAGLVESRRDAQTIFYRCGSGIGSALINTLCEYYR
ncbi:MAG TPA: metalloregulator ArsR/SmtB family transcription factor [Hyphomonas sp.]|mgnify:CR=1 FL=1|nr:metalloregulator ArsR/SmtB family transcription factor [Hyphomonas sp.]